MEIKELENDPSYTIKRVKETSFTINEHLYANDASKIISIDFGHAIGLSVDKKYINFAIIVIYHYADSPIEEKLVEIKVENVFEFNELSKYVDNNGALILPFKILISLVSLCISHTRALLAKNLAGTAFQEIILPIINPLEIAKDFFSNHSTQVSNEDYNSINELNKA